LAKEKKGKKNLPGGKKNLARGIGNFFKTGKKPPAQKGKLKAFFPKPPPTGGEENYFAPGPKKILAGDFFFSWEFFF